jgi:hypothetical protein
MTIPSTRILAWKADNVSVGNFLLHTNEGATWAGPKAHIGTAVLGVRLRLTGLYCQLHSSRDSYQACTQH